jgi:hypothetical protein
MTGHLDVTLANGMLTIRGEKRTERDEHDKDKDWHVVERSYGSFSRAIPLPFDPDPAKVEGKFDKGVLHIHFPKPAEVAPYWVCDLSPPMRAVRASMDLTWLSSEPVQRSSASPQASANFSGMPCAEPLLADRLRVEKRSIRQCAAIVITCNLL